MSETVAGQDLTNPVVILALALITITQVARLVIHLSDKKAAKKLEKQEASNPDPVLAILNKQSDQLTELQNSNNVHTTHALRDAEDRKNEHAITTDVLKEIRDNTRDSKTFLEQSLRRAQ